jgi:hypothetical protein
MDFPPPSGSFLRPQVGQLKIGQAAGQGCSTLGTIRRVFRQALKDKPFQRFRHENLAQLARWSRGVLDVRHDHAHRRIFFEHKVARQ